MQNIEFPVKFEFKITTFSNDFIATDAHGVSIAYVKQKMFKFKEDIVIYSNETKASIEYRIKADRWLDFSAAYSFFDKSGVEFGKIARKGWKSLWRARYEIIDEDERPQYVIREESVWVRILDGIFGEIPILNLLTGYFFHPAYLVTDQHENPVVRLKKQPSFFGRRFVLTKEGELDSDDDDRVMLGLMMMILLERRRG